MTKIHLRKMITSMEEIRSEAGREAVPPLRKVAVVAVLTNPYAGRYEQNLQPLIDASAEIGRTIGKAAVEALQPFKPESYGKGAVIGLAGEQEHGVALLTTVFGNVLRDAVGGGAAWISSYTKRSGPGAIIDIPLAHKDALYVRSHYDGMSVFIPDAPLPDEIAVICCLANRGRANARVGGLSAAEIKGVDGLV